jgi:hypothetical protein
MRKQRKPVSVEFPEYGHVRGRGEAVASTDKTPSLIDVGEHECVTCTRCATTFAKVHPACPECTAQDEIERLREAYDDEGHKLRGALEERDALKKRVERLRRVVQAVQAVAHEQFPDPRGTKIEAPPWTKAEVELAAALRALEEVE